jgi:hypothetical protein
MNAPASITVTPVFVAELLADHLDPRLREWVEAPGVRYVPVDGEPELVWLAHEHEPWRPPA